jgi:hypothetical protein
MLIFIAGVVTGLAIHLIVEFTRHLLELRREKIKREWQLQLNARNEILMDVQVNPEKLKEAIEIYKRPPAPPGAPRAPGFDIEIVPRGETTRISEFKPRIRYLPPTLLAIVATVGIAIPTSLWWRARNRRGRRSGDE